MASSPGWNLYSRLGNLDYRDVLKWSKICLISKQKTFQRLEEKLVNWSVVLCFYHRILNNLRWPAGKIMNSVLNRSADAYLICFFQAAFFPPAFLRVALHKHFPGDLMTNLLLLSLILTTLQFPSIFRSVIILLAPLTAPHPSPKPSMLGRIGKILEIKQCFFPGKSWLKWDSGTKETTFFL